MSSYYLVFQGKPSHDLPKDIFKEILMDAYGQEWNPEQLVEDAEEAEDALAPYFEECEVSEEDSDQLSKALIAVDREVDFIGRAAYEKALLEMIRVCSLGAFSIHRRE